MKKLKLNLQETNNAEVLNRDQLKKIFGGDGGSGNILCYCDSPILPSGQYGIQWLAESCTDQKIAEHCGEGTGTCGAC